MKKINRILAIAGFAGAAVLGTTSCEDKLNALPSQEVVYENLIYDSNSAEVALNGVYYSYALCSEDYNGVKCAGNPMYTEILPSYFAGTLTSDNWWGEMLEPGASSDDNVNYLWTTIYNRFVSSNYVIEGVEGVDSKLFSGNRKNEIIAEARTIRAIGHYNALLYFGYSWDINSQYGAILRDKVMSVSNVPAGRATVKETYNSILADLDFAIANASDNCSNYRFSKWFAEGMKAKVLLHRGQEGDYAEAAKLCKDIIDNGPYELEGNTMDIYRTKGLKSKEIIFAIKPKTEQSTVMEGYYTYSNDMFNLIPAVAGLYADTDTRKADIEQEQEVVDNAMVVMSDGLALNLRHYTLDQIDNYDLDEVAETMVEMRLSEIYLMYAEALIRLNKVSEAMPFVKEVEMHAGVTDFTSFDAIDSADAAMAELFNEFIRNFVCESGVDAAVMLRFPKNLVQTVSSKFEKEEYYILPIPTEEFDANSGLDRIADQNPGY